MKISTRLAFQSTLLSFSAAIILLLLVSHQVRKHALTEAAERAKLILAERQAVIQYTVNHLRPALGIFIKEEGVHPDHFDPTWMSAGYINRTVQDYFNQSDFRDYYYKNAAINARNPKNEASSYEVAFLEEVFRDKNLSSRTKVVRFQGEPFLAYMQVNQSMFSDLCMRCHSTPKNAPADLLNIYGSERGFDKKPGDVASVLSLRIPLGKAYEYVDNLALKIFGVLTLILVCTFFIQWFLTRREVVLPLRRVTEKALAISEDDSLLGDPVEIKGGSELSEMASVFSAMSARLALKTKTLEKDVEEKTSELTKSRIRYQTLFDKMQEGLALHELIYDSSGEAVDYRFLVVNPAFQRLTGLSCNDVVGKTVLEVLPDTEKYWIEMAAQVVRTGAATQFENYAKGLDKFFDTVIFKVDKDRFAVVFRDVTERRKAEKKAVELEDKLKQAHKMEALGTLAGGIAHDFNNILSAVLGYAEMAEQEIGTRHPAHPKIIKIQQAGNRAKEMVAHILAFSRKGDQRNKLVEPEPVVKEAMALLRATIPSNILIRTNITLGKELVYIDPTQLHQVVMNLCTNGYQAMEENGGVLTVSLNCAVLTGKDLTGEYAMSPGDYIHLGVSDTGPGISNEHRDLIFDPYFTTKKIGKGSGMGLSVVHGIIKSSGGLINVDTEPGKGTTFHVYLPKKEKTLQTEGKTDTGVPKMGSGHIMVVDDEEVLAEMSAIRLQRLGYEVDQFTDSKEALSAFTADPYRYDAVITDQTMPQITGDHLAEKMLAVRPELPVILCTGYSSRVDSDMARRIGIRAFVMKPIDQATLSDVLQDVLAGQ